MSEKPVVYQCPECDWKTARELAICPICYSSLQLVRGENAPPMKTGNTFSLTSLFLVLTLLCVGMGAIVAEPGIGIPFVVVSALALARTWSNVANSPATPNSWSAGDRVASFMGSFGIVLLIGIAGMIAFQVACWASCFGVALLGGQQEAFLAGIVMGGISGLLAVFFLLYRTWPRKK